MIIYPSISTLRETFAKKLNNKEIDNGTLEVIGASFLADESKFFGTISYEYIAKEIQWYLSQSLNVNDLEDTPEIWKNVASPQGEINSNYGYLLWNSDNYDQYDNVKEKLKANSNNRQAIAIYTRPSMHEDSTVDGMKDFVCTNAVHYEIRDNKLHVVVQMRSNDAIFGYKNDYAWQRYVQSKLLVDLLPTYPKLELGNIIWQAASFHIYERHFYLVDHYVKTGQLSISKKDYTGLW